MSLQNRSLNGLLQRFWWRMEPAIIRRGEWFVATVQQGNCTYESCGRTEEQARQLHRWGLDGYRCET